MIRKLPNQRKWRVYSKSKHVVDGELVHKNLGTFKNMDAALNRERQIQFFKYRSAKKGKK